MSEWTAEKRLKAGVAPEIVAAMYEMDVKELKKKQREMQKEQEDWGGRIATNNATEQEPNEVEPEVETTDLGTAPKPDEAPEPKPEATPEPEAEPKKEKQPKKKRRSKKNKQ